MKSQRGRPRTTILDSWYEKHPPTASMLELSKLKNAGRTWKEVAEKLSEDGEKLSGALLWKVAKGRHNSERVDIALGLKEKTVPVPPCPECGEVHTKGHPQPGRQDTRRFAAYVSPELFEEVTAEARRRNVTNGEMTEAMWTAYQWTTGQSMLILTPDVSLADEAGEE